MGDGIVTDSPSKSETTGWLPIETVPEEIMCSAAPVLLWSPSTHTHPAYGRYWTQDSEWQEDHMSVPLRPTHWMPLPEPPHAK